MKQVVECYSGSTYAERPVAVHWQGQRLVVEQVLRSWQTPQGPGFDVLVADGRTFRLSYDESSDTWQVTTADGTDPTVIDPMPGRSSLSQAASYLAIGEFWDTHDSADLWEQTEPAEFTVNIETET